MNANAKPVPSILRTRWDLADGHTLERYLDTGGYEGLRQALSAMTPDEVTEEVKAASLLGRGGAGFPAGVKWGFVPPGVFPRYLVVNGDESEPGTYKDRIIMERDPHHLIEGVLIACYAIGAARPSSTCGARWRWRRSASPRRSTTPTPPATSVGTSWATRTSPSTWS